MTDFQSGDTVEVFSDSGWEEGIYVGKVDNAHYVIPPLKMVAVAYDVNRVRKPEPKLYTNWAVGDHLYRKDTPSELRYLVLNVTPDQEFVKVLNVKENEIKDFTSDIQFSTYVFATAEFTKDKWIKV